MQKTFLSLFITLLAGLQLGFAQSYVVSGIEKTDKDGMQYEILGKVGQNYWVYKKNKSVATIAQYNAQMQVVKQNDLSFLPANIRFVEFINEQNKVRAFYQYQIGTTMYAAIATINAEGQLAATPQIIDTAEKIRPGSSARIFNLLESDDHTKHIMFSVNTSNPASIKVNIVALNTEYESEGNAVISISSVSKKSSLSDFALDNQGNLFCLRNTTEQGAAPAVSLIYMANGGKEVVESPILNNSLLLDDIRLKVDNKNNRVLLNSFYATSRKGNVEGLFSFIWDVNTKQSVVSNATRFTDATRAMVTKKKRLKDAFDSYYIDQVSPKNDGGFTVIAEAAETFSNRAAFSRWDYYWGGAFYNPFMFNYWSRPFGFYPWSRFGYSMFGFGWGWGAAWMNPYAGFGYPSVTYTANQVALMSFDNKGDLQWTKTIDKTQSDMNVDQFIGYGSFENSMGTQFIYYQRQKGQRAFVIHTLNAAVELIKGNNVAIQEKRLDWMPRSLKQVGENEVILPYQYNNKIGFAKIQLK